MKVEMVLKNLFTSGSVTAYNLKKPEKCTLPVVVYKRIGTRKIAKNFSNSGDLEDVLMRFSVIGSDYESVVNLSDTVDSLLDYNTSNFEFCMFAGNSENYTEDTKLYDFVFDFEIINKL